MPYKYLEFSKTLAGLYYTQTDIVALLIKANLSPGHFNLTGSSGIIFLLMVKQLEMQDSVKLLAVAALDDYPNNIVIRSVVENWHEDVKSVYDGTQPSIPNTTSKAEFEKITRRQSTLLPISFLEKGMQMALSVARIVTPSGLGTGFLISDSDLLITNNHVINRQPDADGFKAQFNYQGMLNGLAAVYDDFEIDDSVFHTCVADDWTVVKLKGNPSKKYGYIPLRNVTTRKDDFVNIIQHPGGEFKQIALYHNLVTVVNDQVVQYLTDTLPGSSGSPVFNSTWDVVALHHSGGWFPIQNGSNILCNEGININKILPELQTLNLI